MYGQIETSEMEPKSIAFYGLCVKRTKSTPYLSRARLGLGQTGRNCLFATHLEAWVYSREAAICKVGTELCLLA